MTKNLFLFSAILTMGWIFYEMYEVPDGGGSIENLYKTAKIFPDYMNQFK